MNRIKSQYENESTTVPSWALSLFKWAWRKLGWLISICLLPLASFLYNNHEAQIQQNRQSQKNDSIRISAYHNANIYFKRRVDSTLNDLSKKVNHTK